MIPFVLLLLSLLPTGILSNPCFNVNVCDCTDTVVSCRCHGSHRHITVLAIGLTTRPQQMFISDCHKVEFFSGVLSNLDSLTHLEVKNVSVLIVMPFAMSNLHHYKRILFQDLVIHTILSYTFSNISHVDRIVFNNVTIKMIQENAFSNLHTIQQLSIINSTIEELHSNAFNETILIDSLNFENTFIAYVETEALMLQDIGKINFQDCQVRHWETRAMVLKNVTNVLFNKTGIAELKAFAWEAKDVSYFDVVDCEFDKINGNAFWELRNIPLSLYKNKFHQAKNNSLFTYPMGESKWIINDNYFPCDHTICWLFDESFYNIYGTVIASSKCLEPPTQFGQPLDSIKVHIDDDEDFCQSDQFSGRHGLEQEITTESTHVLVTEVKVSSQPTTLPSAAVSCYPVDLLFTAIITFTFLLSSMEGF